MKKHIKRIVFIFINSLGLDRHFGHMFNNKFLKKAIFTPDFYRNQEDMVIERDGTRFKIDPSDYMQWSLLYGETDGGVMAVISNCSNEPDTVVFDVGANCGQFCIKAANALNRINVVAFEPNPIIINRLKANIQLNPILDKRIRIVPCAVGDKPGVLSLDMPVRNSGAASLLRDYSHEDHVTCEVNIVSIDQFVKENNIKVVHFLKIDVENFEPYVLLGAKEVIERYKPSIFIEQGSESHLNHGFNQDWVYEFLKNMGYSMFIYDNGTFLPIKDFSEIKNIPIFNMFSVYEQGNNQPMKRDIV